jgi:hypothetical protein
LYCAVIIIIKLSPTFFKWGKAQYNGQKYTLYYILMQGGFNANTSNADIMLRNKKINSPPYPRILFFTEPLNLPMEEEPVSFESGVAEANLDR